MWTFVQSLCLECPEIHQNDVGDKQDDGKGDLAVDDAILVLGFQDSGRYDVEVGRHGGHQGATVTRGQGERAGDPGVCALRIDEGDAMPAVMTAKAAKALPMIMVKRAIPTQ